MGMGKLCDALVFSNFMQAFPLTRNIPLMLAGRIAANANQAAGLQSIHTPSGSAEKKITISHEDWEQRFARAKINKADMNKLVMNYLTTEGYKEAAERFAAETGVKTSIELSTIDQRMQVRAAIQNGRIDEAIELINNIDPDILDYNPRIIFHLLQQKLIELIREGNVERALEFAQEEVAPKGESNPEFLIELEKTMTLLILAPNGVPLTGTSDLLDPYHRIRVANEVNAALLASQGLEAESKLPSLLKLLLWSQDQLAANANFPKINNLIEATFTLNTTDKTGTQ